MLEDFIPWKLPTDSLHFNVVVDGVPYAARVTRGCLSDHKLIDFELTTREQFAMSWTADELRRIAAAKLARGEEAIVRSADWRDHGTPGRGRVQDASGKWFAYRVTAEHSGKGLSVHVYLDDGTGERSTPFAAHFDGLSLSKSAERGLALEAIKRASEAAN